MAHDASTTGREDPGDPPAGGPVPRRQAALRSVALLLARYEIRNLRRLYDEFEQDILLPILLGEIALHNIGAREHAIEMRPSESATDAGEEPPCSLKPCNAYSIAAATGLPRETVRRKIARLVELGWISKRHNGHLYVTSRALRHFGEILSSRDLGELLDMADRVRQLLRE
jgi:hypothetical protein